MKRILSLILSLALAFSLMPSAFAASNEAVQAAEALHSLGLFNGTGTDANGNPIYDLDRAPTRQEAITMLVRLLGKEDAAKQGTWKPPFTDVDSWAAPYVGYAYSNGLTSGTSATTFSGNNTVTTSQYLSFVLRALGYTSGTDFQWDKAWELSDKIGLTKGNYNATTKSFTRGDVAVISNQSLSIPTKNSSQTLSDATGLSQKKALIGDWGAVHKSGTDGISIAEIYRFNGNQYSCVYEFFFSDTYATVGIGYEEGTYSIGENSLTLSSTQHYSYNSQTKKMTTGKNSSSKYNFLVNETSLQLNDFTYGNYTGDKDTISKYNSIKQAILKRVPTTQKTDYSYLVLSDFRSIRREYPRAVATRGYALPYTNIDGELCVISCVKYKIISSFEQITLYNMTTGKTISNPESYFDTLVDRAFGTTKLHYMNLRLEYTEQLEALYTALLAGNSTGSTGNGTYVTGDRMNGQL